MFPVMLLASVTCRSAIATDVWCSAALSASAALAVLLSALLGSLVARYYSAPMRRRLTQLAGGLPDGVRRGCAPEPCRRATRPPRPPAARTGGGTQWGSLPSCGGNDAAWSWLCPAPSAWRSARWTAPCVPAARARYPPGPHDQSAGVMPVAAWKRRRNVRSLMAALAAQRSAIRKGWSIRARSASSTGASEPPSSWSTGDSTNCA